MFCSRRATLALAVVVTLSLAIAPRGGLYTPMSVVLAVVAMLLALAACLRPDRLWPVPAELGARVISYAAILLGAQAVFLAFVYTATDSLGKPVGPVKDGVALAVAVIVLALLVLLARRPPRPHNVFHALLVAAGLLLSGYGVLMAFYLFGDQRGARTPLLVAAALAGLLLNASWILDLGSAGPSRRWFWPRVLALFTAGALLRISPVLASPDPVIDVYAWLDQAPAKLLHGDNPYAADYVSPYGTERARQFDTFLEPDPRPAAYPPLPILVALPFKAAGLDVRYANVVCDLLAALVFLLLGCSTGNRWLGAVLSGIYLFLPRVPYLIEMAWYEPMLAALLGWGLFLVERRRRLGYLLLGLGLTGKQFGLPLLLPLAGSLRRRLLGLLLGIGLALLLFVPFVLWDPKAFLDIVLFKHLRRPPMADSITIHSGFLNLLGVDLPRPLLLAVAGLLLGWLTWKTPAQVTAGALWMATALLTFCLFHTQGYFNYFYLCQYLVLIALPGLVAASGAEVPGR
jgi:hypothetical protein